MKKIALLALFAYTNLAHSGLLLPALNVTPSVNTNGRVTLFWERPYPASETSVYYNVYEVLQNTNLSLVGSNIVIGTTNVFRGRTAGNDDTFIIRSLKVNSNFTYFVRTVFPPGTNESTPSNLATGTAQRQIPTLPYNDATYQYSISWTNASVRTNVLQTSVDLKTWLDAASYPGTNIASPNVNSNGLVTVTTINTGGSLFARVKVLNPTTNAVPRPVISAPLLKSHLITWQGTPTNRYTLYYLANKTNVSYTTITNVTASTATTFRVVVPLAPEYCLAQY